MTWLVKCDRCGGTAVPIIGQFSLCMRCDNGRADVDIDGKWYTYGPKEYAFGSGYYITNDYQILDDPEHPDAQFELTIPPANGWQVHKISPGRYKISNNVHQGRTIPVRKRTRK